MQEALETRFGQKARGLWLTERVWEPDLAKDLADAGVAYVLVDDRHFVASGFDRDQLHRPFLTEFGGKSLGVFAIDETLRYYIPFRPPEDTVGYIRSLREAGHRLAVFADDIEKFGGWPGTREWVYEKGWLDRFIQALKELEGRGELRMATFGEILEKAPSGGLVYLPSASYREMEEWTLPPGAFHRLEEMKDRLREGRASRGRSPLVRGSHWRNFMVKYPEANRMHKKALALSRLCRERGDPEEARRALGAAQCNDAYWHGVFGGLYLRHLRDAIWQELAKAEGLLRLGEPLRCEGVDLDLDGHEELWVHSASFSALVAPDRGGGVEELTVFDKRINLGNTLTRRREAYHQPRDRGETTRPTDDPVDQNEASGAPSIHDLEEDLRFSQLPPVDLDDRALFLERVLPGEVGGSELEAGTVQPAFSWASGPLRVLGVEEKEGTPPDEEGSDPIRWIEICLGDPSGDRFEKRLRFGSDGLVEALFAWNPQSFPEGSVFTTEISLSADTEIQASPDATTWRYPISTFSKSEAGFDETVQGTCVVLGWPIDTGRGRVLLRLG
jgi:alpha-amylase